MPVDSREDSQTTKGPPVPVLNLSEIPRGIEIEEDFSNYYQGDKDLFLIAKERARVVREISSITGLPANIFGGSGLQWAIDNVPLELGERFDAHGISRGDPIEAINSLITTGVQKGSVFYTMPFARVGEYKTLYGAPYPRTEGGIIVTSNPDDYLINTGVRFVFLGEEYLRSIEIFRQKYPGVEFIPWNLTPGYLSDLLKSRTGEAIDVPELKEENRPHYSVAELNLPISPEKIKQAEALFQRSASPEL